MKIGNKLINKDSQVYIVLEVARTYKNLSEFKEMVEIAADAGADAIKIQSILSSELMIKNNNTENYIKMLDSLYRSKEEHIILKNICEQNNIDFLSTPEGEYMADLLNEIDTPAFKVSSLNLINYRLLKKILTHNKPVIISTGMSTEEEIDLVYSFFKSQAREKDLAFLHCSSTYPTKAENCNLKNISMLKDKYDCTVGYSDHSIGIAAPILAISLGAKIIEKHFTLDRNQEGADHLVGVDEKMLRNMIIGIREAEQMLGNYNRVLCSDEESMRQFKRRKIVTKTNIRKEQLLTEDCFLFLQTKSNEGIDIKFINDIINKKASKDLDANTIIEWKDII